MSNITKSLISQNQIDMLSHIGSMKIIMIFNRPFVFIVNLHNELQEFMVVNDLQKIIRLKQCSGHKWHLHVPSDIFGKVKYIELVTMNIIEIKTVLIHQLFNMLNRQIKVDSIFVYFDTFVFRIAL